MTIKDIAKMAGVSVATVSLVLNGKRGVSKEKKDLILRLVEEQNFKVRKKHNVQSRNILFIKYSKEGIIIEENTEFVAKIIDSAEEECKKLNFKLTITTRAGSIEKALQGIDYSYFCGMIILGTEVDEGDYKALEKIPIPYVIVDNSMPHFSCNCVYIDNKENSYQAVRYFAKKGFQEVGYFKSKVKIQNFIEREKGFWEGVNKHKLLATTNHLFEIPPTMLGALEYTLRYIKEKRNIPPCIFVDNDTMAIGVMKALIIAGYKIPQEVSVIGFDDIPFAKIYSPTISTINVDNRRMGSLSLVILKTMFEDDNYTNIKMKTMGQLIERESTGERAIS